MHPLVSPSPIHAMSIFYHGSHPLVCSSPRLCRITMMNNKKQAPPSDGPFPTLAMLLLPCKKKTLLTRERDIKRGTRHVMQKQDKKYKERARRFASMPR